MKSRIKNKTYVTDYKGLLYKYQESVFGSKILEYSNLGAGKWANSKEIRLKEKLKTKKEFKKIIPKYH